MTDETSAPAGGEAMPAADAPVQDSGGDLSISQAARLLAQHRNRPKETPSETNEAARAFVAEQPSDAPELAQADADPETDPSEATADAEPEENLPPIEPPRSWTKAEKERFQSLPRETQEYLHTREQERDRDFRRGQNELAETRKAAVAEREAAEKARQEYEAKLPGVMQAMHDASPFADIKSMADVEKLQAEDPFRFQQFQVYQWKMQAAQTELQQAESRKSQETQTNWANHVQKENALAAEKIPDLADKVKGPALTQRAADRLEELGFKQEELADLASGKERLSIYDHRIQQLIFSDLKLAEIQSATKAVAAKPVPPVQRPGTAKPQGNAATGRLQALEEKFNRTGSLKDAQALRAAQLARR